MEVKWTVMGKGKTECLENIKLLPKVLYMRIPTCKLYNMERKIRKQHDFPPK